MLQLRPFRRRAVAVTAATTLLAGAVIATTVRTASAKTTGATHKITDEKALQQGLDDIVAGGATGALAEVRDDHTVWHGTSGTAVAGTDQPVPADGRFRAGSVTKTFLATVVMQLVAQHRIGLDQPVDTWLPGRIPAGDKITVRDLLGHTSGLYDVTDTLPLNPPSAFLPLRWRTWTSDELVDRAIAQPSLFAPGTEYHYSSTDYEVLGLIIQKATGRSWADEIERRILHPLRLYDTSLPGTNPTIPGPHSHGYLPDDPRPIDITEMNPSVYGSAGSLISTARDLNRFFAALLDGRLLPRPQLHEMTDVVSPSQTGLGLERLQLTCGRIAYGHDGDALGYSTWSFRTADRRHQVTVSMTWGTGRPSDAAKAFVDQALCQ
jgi:D-alanyl-D-alanine carboxypeptidase